MKKPSKREMYREVIYTKRDMESMMERYKILKEENPNSILVKFYSESINFLGEEIERLLIECQ